MITHRLESPRRADRTIVLGGARDRRAGRSEPDGHAAAASASPIVDSGVHASHPHVGAVAGGIAIDATARSTPTSSTGWVTAPPSPRRSAKRRRTPSCSPSRCSIARCRPSIASLVDGIDWARAAGMHVVESQPGHAAPRARGGAGRRRSSARPARTCSSWRRGRMRGSRGCRGACPACCRWKSTGRCRAIATVSAVVDGVTVFYASGFAREIPGVPPERNLHGISLAVANMTGFVARAIEGASDRSLAAVVVRLLSSGAPL